MIDAVKEHFKQPFFQDCLYGNCSFPEAPNDGKMTHMGMMDTGFTVVAEEWVLLLVYVIHKPSLLVTNVYFWLSVLGILCVELALCLQYTLQFPS
jgi:hypothetical protein